MFSECLHLSVALDIFVRPSISATYSSLAGVHRGPSPHSTPSIFELLEANGITYITILPKNSLGTVQTPQETQCMAQSKCSINMSYYYKKKCLLNEYLIELLDLGGLLLEKSIIY